MTTQPEALRLAAALDAAPYSSPCTNDAAAELRRLHEVNRELLEALKMLRNAYIGTCVEAQADAMRDARAAIAKHQEQA